MPAMTAILVIIESFVVNSQVFNSKIVTGCWSGETITIQVRDLINPGTPSSWEIFTIVNDVTTCSDADEAVFWWNREYLRAIVAPNQELGCDLVNENFCCVTLQEISLPSDPLYSDVPYINLGDGNKKYKVIEVRCRP